MLLQICEAKLHLSVSDQSEARTPKGGIGGCELKSIMGRSCSLVAKAPLRLRQKRFLDHARRGPAQQVHPGACLVVRAARPSTAEGLLAHDSARGLGVDVQVAGSIGECALRLQQRFAVNAED